MPNFCGRQLPNRSKYADIAQKRCHKLAGHKGKCSEFPFLSELKKTNRRVAAKIKRDSRMTTGAAWKSDDAGPNRILRWVMLLSDEDLLNYGLDMSKLRPGIISKLRDKAATYEDCINVAIKLTALVYQMEDSPKPPERLRDYLESFYGPLDNNSTVCAICKMPISFNLFEGRAEIETCHKDPRHHDSDNVAFAHRQCNIAQGNMTLDEFYDWISGILSRID
jgi:hypothetical protein